MNEVQKMDISSFFPSTAQKRLEAVASHLDSLNLSDAETKHLSYAISSRGRFRGAHTGKIRTMRCPKKNYSTLQIKFGCKKKMKCFHCLQGAAFPHLCGRLTAQRPTWDHISNDRAKPAYMYAENLRPASRTEQNLNRTVNDNPVEGRPVGSVEDWTTFRNPGRAAVALAVLEPVKNWSRECIYCVANGRNKSHQGWEFRWPEGAVPVRNAVSAPSEAPLLEDEIWRAMVLPDGAAAPAACRVSSLGRYCNSTGHIRTIKPCKRHEYAAICVEKKSYKVHNVVGATFAHLIGPKPSAAHTLDHKNRDPTDNRVSNLAWEDKSAQALNQSNNDNPIEGRPAGSTGSWTTFRNSGRAAVALAELEPAKNWLCSKIGRVANGGAKRHQGWEFRWPEGSVQVRIVSSQPTEVQWRDDGDFADEEWARLEPRADGTILVTPELRDGRDGESFLTTKFL